MSNLKLVKSRSSDTSKGNNIPWIRNMDVEPNVSVMFHSRKVLDIKLINPMH